LAANRRSRGDPDENDDDDDDDDDDDGALKCFTLPNPTGDKTSDSDGFRFLFVQLDDDDDWDAGVTKCGIRPPLSFFRLRSA